MDGALDFAPITRKGIVELKFPKNRHPRLKNTTGNGTIVDR